MSKQNNKTILITGGAGFIGSYLASYLLKKGYSVIIIDDLSTGAAANIKELLGFNKLKLIIDDVSNKKIAEELVSKSDVVFHLAACVGVRYILENPIKTILNNIKSTETVLDFCNRYRRKVILTSSSEVYGLNLEYINSKEKRLSENSLRVMGSTQNTRWAYAATKEMDEFLALAYYKEYSLPVIILRLFNIVGPRQSEKYGMVLPNFVKSALLNMPITVYGDGRQIRSFASVYDIVRIFHKILLEPNCVGKIINVGNDNGITIYELAKKVKKLCNSKSEIIFMDYKDAYGEGFEDMQRRVPDISLLKLLIKDYPKISIDEIIQQVKRYYKTFIL